MRFLTLALAVALSASGVGCMTYSQDLNRAKTHYEANQYEAALALFRVLEVDFDSLNHSEQAQYSYLRGMTDFRLSSLASAGSNVSDPKRAFRDNARHWLGVAAAIEKVNEGGLNADEKKRLGETLEDLNQDVFGGAEIAAKKKEEHDPEKP